MTPIPATYLDGRSTRPRAVQLRCGDGRLWLEGEDTAQDYPLADCRPGPRLAGQPWVLRLPDGGACQVADPDALASCLATAGHAGLGRQTALLRWESRPARVVLALLLTLAVGWLALDRGAPLLARHVAENLPYEVDEALGRQVMESLDEFAFKPSRLPEPRQARMQALMRQAAAGLPDAGRYRLHLRRGGPIGANALALPGGEMVFTDELVELARNDAEILAVLAHELGHQQHRHALRSVLQDSLATLLIATLTGDIFSQSAFAAALPTLLLKTGYSRDFEREADQFARDRLTALGQPPQALGDLLLRLEDKEGGSPPAWLSTHPAAAERARPASPGR